jgi:hypothetical protein
LTYYLKLSAQTIQEKNASKMFETKNSIYLPNMSDFGIWAPSGSLFKTK